MTDAITANASKPLQLTVNPLPESSSKSAVQPQSFFSADGPNFKDVLDFINPLQHIPIVSSIYRSVTGDVPSTGAKIAGDTLFGGVIGLVGSVFDSIIQQQTGKDIAGNVLAAIRGDDVPAMHPSGVTATSKMASDAPPDNMIGNRRYAYNAYVNAGSLA
jgi:hypothetical protein